MCGGRPRSAALALSPSARRGSRPYHCADGRHRVLVADDDPRLTQLISQYLTLEGYEVETVADGLVAVERATALPPPDVVVLDIMMPGIDGIEACRRIRANFATAGLPILIFSALGEQGETARLAGADAMLKKPFTLPVLGQAVQRLTGA